MVPRFDEIQLFENHFLAMGITMIAWISSIQWYHMSPKYSISGQQKHRSCWKTPAFCQNSSFQPKYCSQNSDFHHILHGKQRNCMENCQIACSTSSNSSKSLLCFDFHEHSKKPRYLHFPNSHVHPRCILEFSWFWVNCIAIVLPHMNEFIICWRWSSRIHQIHRLNHSEYMRSRNSAISLTFITAK